MYLGGKRVDLKKLTMPLLNFFGEYDHLVPPDACNQLTGAVGSKDVEDVRLETGHIGIYVSSRFQKMFAPKIVQWLKDRDSQDIVAAPEKAPALSKGGPKPRVKHKVSKVQKKTSASEKKSAAGVVEKEIVGH